MSFQYHPDTSSETNSHERFIEVNEAFKTLSKPISRRDYDLRLKFGPKPGAENFEYKTNEDPRESQPSWREKPYWCVLVYVLFFLLFMLICQFTHSHYWLRGSKLYMKYV